MYKVLYIALIGLITGIIGTFSGGLIVILLKKTKEKFLTFILGISAGVMTVVVFLDLVPESLELGNITTALSGMLAGVILLGILDYVFPHEYYAGRINNSYYKSGILLAVGIALHNIPEGLAIGAGYSASSHLGLGLAIIIGVHNFPEGMAVATSLCLAGMSSWQIILIIIFAGMPMGIGAFLGGYMGNISQFFLSLSLGFAAGAMLFITFDDLIPAVHQKNTGKLAIMGILLGVFLGIFLTSKL